MPLRGEPGRSPPVGKLVGVQPERAADGGGRPRGAGLLGTEPSSDGVSMSSRRDASGASPGDGRGGLREQGGLRGDRQHRGYTKHSWAGAGVRPGAGGCWAQRCSASIPVSPVPLLAGWGTPGGPYLSPLVPAFMGTTFLPGSFSCPWDEVVPVSRGESQAPHPSCSCIVERGCLSPTTLRLRGDPPVTCKALLGPAGPMHGHHTWRLV